MLRAVLLVFAIVNAIRAQETTASLFPVGFEEDGLQGEAIGTQSGETTFVLSGTFDSFGIPFTMTLVEDATHIVEVADVPITSGITLNIQNECDFSGGQGTCTEVIVDAASTTMTVISGGIDPTGVPLRAGSGSALSGSGSETSSSSTRTQITFTGTTATISTLPPTIPVSTSRSLTSTATITGTGTAFPSSLPTSSASSNAISKAFGVASALVLSVLLLS